MNKINSDRPNDYFSGDLKNLCSLYSNMELKMSILYKSFFK